MHRLVHEFRVNTVVRSELLDPIKNRALYVPVPAAIRSIFREMGGHLAQNDFKRMMDGRHVDLLDHVRAVLDHDPDVTVYVGSDSHNRSHHTVYATTVVLRFHQNGAQVIYRRERAPKVNDLWTRLWGEVERSLEVARYLSDSGHVLVHGIDMDINSDERFPSNKLHTAAVGYIRSYGYEPHTKPELLPATWAANVLCNRGRY